jgi:hydrogenase expression/formation protein HypC
MCMGIPYEVIEPGFLSARARSRRGEAVIDMRLVGDQPVGTHVLCFLDAAREVISAELAGQIADALEALELAMNGDGDIDHLFADLIGREPQLPEHLRSTLNILEA